VTAGQVLASIDTPDQDQQLEQAKAELATAHANEQLAAVTFGEAGDLSKRIRGGEIADVAVLPRIVLDRVLAEGDVFVWVIWGDPER
jgi:multidrug efflux pump subunit AcrA (membrane-fusion protein)